MNIVKKNEKNNIIKLYKDLPTDMKEKINKNVFQSTNAKTLTKLATVNRAFQKKYDPTVKLQEIITATRTIKTSKDGINVIPEQFDKLTALIGDKRLQDIKKNKTLMNHLDNIYGNSINRSNEIELLQFQSKFSKLKYDNYSLTWKRTYIGDNFIEAKNEYITKYGIDSYNKNITMLRNSLLYKHTSPSELRSFKNTLKTKLNDLKLYDLTSYNPNATKTIKNYLDLTGYDTYKKELKTFKKLDDSVLFLLELD